MENDRKRINIMTSCNNDLTDYIFVQIRTMAIHLRDKEVHLFFFYNRVPEEKLEKLEIYCDCFSNITFHRVFIEEIEPYVKLAKQGTILINKWIQGYSWPYEAYFTLACNQYLPEDVDRIWYIDAGDVVLVDGIDDYYFDDFDNKSLIVTLRIARPDGTPFQIEDLNNEDFFKRIKTGIFNSGSYIINIDKLRKENLTIEDVMKTVEKCTKTEDGYVNYMGDQGPLSMHFIDDIKYFKLENSKFLNTQG